MLSTLQAAGLLLISNLFMTAAWYEHLKDKSRVLWLAILISWGIAFFEYCFQVPANRIGSEKCSAHAIEGHAGMHRAGRLYCLCVDTHRRTIEMEYDRQHAADCGRGIFCVYG